MTSRLKFMARRIDTFHTQMQYAPSGYVTAWFLCLLQGEEETAKAFIGIEPERMSNPFYLEQQSDMG